MTTEPLDALPPHPAFRSDHRTSVARQVRLRECEGGRGSGVRAYSRGLMARLGLSQTLRAHRGCVNTVHWSGGGDFLLSGSDEGLIALWGADRPPRDPLEYAWHSGHRANIFSVRFMPQSADNLVASCSADSTVRVFDIQTAPKSSIFNPQSQYDSHAHAQSQSRSQSLQSHSLQSRAQRGGGGGGGGGGRHVPPPPTRAIPALRVFLCHDDSAKRLATVPEEAALLWSCAEDGTVRQFDIRAPHVCRLGCRCPSTLLAETRDSLNAISANQARTQYLAVGGSQPEVLVYDRRHAARPCLAFLPSPLLPKLRHPMVAVTGLSFSADGSELVASYSADYIYTFSLTASSPVHPHPPHPLPSSPSLPSSPTPPSTSTDPKHPTPPK